MTQRFQARGCPAHGKAPTAGPPCQREHSLVRSILQSVKKPVHMDLNESLALRRQPLKAEVFDVLHKRILAGEYAPGQWLRQEEISSQLGVSMTPVREALDLLVSSGLAERVPYRGVRILKPSGPEILDSYELRLLLECAATYAAALSISAQQLAGLHKLLDQGEWLVKLEHLPQERALSRDLHSAIVAAAGNPLLHKIYLTVLNTFPDWMLYEHLFRHPELLEESMHSEHQEHRLIVEALGAHDPQMAVQRTLEHVINRGRELETCLRIPAESVRAREAQVLPLLAGGWLLGQPIEKEIP